MQFRGGTTSKKGAELANKPVQCIEYVLGHEMDDPLEPTHNLRFGALMDCFPLQWQFHRQASTTRASSGISE